MLHSKRRPLGVGLLVLLGLQHACYVYTPARAVRLEPGTPYAFDLTDRGRVALGERLGPGVASVEGRLISADNEQYVLSVARVETLDRKTSHWTGEQLNIRQDFVGSVRERRFSRGRTALAAAITLGSIALFAVTRELLGFGSSTEGGEPPPPPPGS